MVRLKLANFVQLSNKNIKWLGNLVLWCMQFPIWPSRTTTTRTLMARRHPSQIHVQKRSSSRSDLLRSFKPKSEPGMRSELKNKFIYGASSLSTRTIRTSLFLCISFRKSPKRWDDLSHSSRASMRRSLTDIQHSSRSRHSTHNKLGTSDQRSLIKLSISKTPNTHSSSTNTSLPSSNNSSSTNSPSPKVSKSHFKIQRTRLSRQRRISRRLWPEAALLKTASIWN